MLSDSILVVDANNLAARCHFSLRELTDSAGKKTGVLYGVLNSLCSAIGQFNPKRIVLCWDGGRSDWRMQLYPEYKASRSAHREANPEAEEDHRQYLDQLRVLQEILLPYYPITSLKFRGCEADDIAAWASLVEFRDSPVIILSSDEDFYQLISPRIEVWSPNKETFITLDSLRENWGITPEQYLIAKSFRGDGSDEIEGYPGIGEKRARDIVQHIGTGNLEDYVSPEAFEFYSSKKALSVVTPDNVRDTLVRNYMLMNLSMAISRFPAGCTEEFSTLVNSPRVFRKSELFPVLLKYGMRQFATSFEKHCLPWHSLVSQ